MRFASPAELLCTIINMDSSEHQSFVISSAHLFQNCVSFANIQCVNSFFMSTLYFSCAVLFTGIQPDLLPVLLFYFSAVVFFSFLAAGQTVVMLIAFTAGKYNQYVSEKYVGEPDRLALLNLSHT